MTEESKDCWQCRLTSGGGLLAAGAYVVHQSKKIKSNSHHVVASIGFGLGFLGLLRLLALPPFKTSLQQVPKAIVEDKEENDYIIGKLSTKFN